MKTIKKLVMAQMVIAFFFALIVISCEEINDFDTPPVFEVPVVGAEADITNIGSGDTITFTDNSTKVRSREWTFPGGTPASSPDSVVMVSFVNPSTTDIMNVEVILSVTHLDNTISKDTIAVVVEAAEATGGGGGGTPLGPLNIAFVTENAASDAGYITLLQGKGHTVEAVDFKYANLDAAGATTLNTFDLIIISRNTNSASYGDAARPNWATVTKPIILVSAFIARNTRLQFLDNATTNEANVSNLDATVATHPVFTNVSLTAGKTGDISTASLHTLATGSVGTGTLIATANGQVAIAEWAANTASYTGGTVFAAKRMFVAVNGGAYALNATGDQLFLDCIEYIITGAVISTGGGGSGLPFRILNVAFVTDDVASDQGYIDLLVGKGHTVEAVALKYNNLDAAGATTLNGFDLVIISRNTNSGNFSDAARPAWMTVTKPVLNLSSFVARNTRLHYFDTPNQIETGGTSIKATDASHLIFTNVTLDVDGAVAVTAGALHVVGTASAGNGTLIGTTADGTSATIAVFAANTAAYTGGAVFAGKRMFLSGTGGGFTYNEAGSQLFLNCVDYIAN